MARTRIHHEEKKKDIICIALHEFMIRGYEQTTINHILKAADISKGALYHYFSSKEQILDGVMEYLMNNEVARLQSLIADPALSGRDKFIRLLAVGVQKPEDLEQILDSYRKIRDSLFHYRLQEESMLATAGVFTVVIAEGAERGEFHLYGSPAVLGECIAGVLQNMITATESEHGEASELGNRVEMFIRMLEWGLGVEHGTFSVVGSSLYEQILIYRGCRYN